MLRPSVTHRPDLEIACFLTRTAVHAMVHETAVHEAAVHEAAVRRAERLVRPELVSETVVPLERYRLESAGQAEVGGRGAAAWTSAPRSKVRRQSETSSH